MEGWRHVEVTDGAVSSFGDKTATLFGSVAVRLPRFCCAKCGGTEAGNKWPSHCRSTPELDRLQAHLCALMPYREAVDVLAQMLPLDAGKGCETLRRHTLKIGASLRHEVVSRSETEASAIDTSLDSTFIRSCEDGERHLEVMTGNVETEAGGRQVFAAVAKSGTDIKEQISESLDAVGRTADTALTAFTDGCSGLWRILTDAGVAELPILVLSALAPASTNLTGTSSPLRRRQDADHREGAGEDMQAAVAGGNMLVTIERGRRKFRSSSKLRQNLAADELLLNPRIG